MQAQHTVWRATGRKNPVVYRHGNPGSTIAHTTFEVKKRIQQESRWHDDWPIALPV